MIVEYEDYKKVQDVLKRCVYRKDCKLLFSVSQAKEYKFNDIAEFFFFTVLRESTFFEAVSKIANHFEVDIAIIERDLTHFLLTFNEEVQGSKSNLQLEKNIEWSKLQAPFAVEFELTKVCNFRCPFCYNTWKHHDKGNGERKMLSKDLIKDVLCQCKEHGVFKVRYSGGEPTLYPDLCEILKCGYELGLFQSIFTNAYSLSEDTIKTWNDYDVNEVLVSMHGLDSVHDEITGIEGSLKKTILNISKMIDRGIHVIVEMTLIHDNVAQIDSVIDLLCKFGITEFRIMKYVPNGVKELDEKLCVDDEMFSNVKKQLLKNENINSGLINVAFPCSQFFCDRATKRVISPDIEQFMLQNCLAGINWMAIDYQGGVKNCPHSIDVVDNIYREGFSLLAAWNTLKSNTEKKIRNRKECHQCEKWKKCLGGCLLNDK